MTKDNPKEQSLTPEYPDSPTVEVDNYESSGNLTGAKGSIPPDGTDPDTHSQPIVPIPPDRTDSQPPGSKPEEERKPNGSNSEGRPPKPDRNRKE